MKEEYYALRVNSLAGNAESLKNALKQLPVEIVTVRYSGSGDSGDIVEIDTIPPDALTQLNEAEVQLSIPKPHLVDGEYCYEMKDIRQTLSEALKDFAIFWSEHQHRGWENNEGGCGEMTIKVSANTCTLQHTEYFTESIAYEYSL